MSGAVDPRDAAALVEAGSVDVVDVREPEEFAAGHLPSGRNVPLGTLSDQAAALDPARPLLVHCQTGPRQAMAAAALRAAGYDVTELAGGFEAWREAGLPVTAGSDPS